VYHYCSNTVQKASTNKAKYYFHLSAQFLLCSRHAAGWGTEPCNKKTTAFGAARHAPAKPPKVADMKPPHCPECESKRLQWFFWITALRRTAALTAERIFENVVFGSVLLYCCVPFLPYCYCGISYHSFRSACSKKPYVQTPNIGRRY
jgi:hypothetical protein